MERYDRIRCASIVGSWDGSGLGEGERPRDVGIATCLSKPLRQAELLRQTARAMDAADSAPGFGTLPPGAQPAGTPRLSFDADVLVVEHPPVNRELAVAILRQLGCRVEVADNGRAGLQAVRERRYDSVLMDCQMPEMDRLESTAAIRLAECDGAARLPIVVLTAHPVAGDRERCLAVGIDEYLSKPSTRAQLQDVLVRWLPKAGSAQHTVPAPEAPVIDKATLESIRAIGGDDLLARMIGLFTKDGAALLHRLGDAVAHGNATAVASAADALKSVSLNLGAVALGELCKRIELDARGGIIRSMRLARQYDAAVAALERRLQVACS